MRFNKYRAKATNGFPSKLESAVYDILVQREADGEISEIRRQHTVILQDGPANQKISWKVDFSFIKEDILWFAEAKGIETESYKLKLKLWRALCTNPLEIWKGSYQKPKLVEIVR